MLRHDPKIAALMYESAIDKLSKIKNITLQESRIEISKMSFIQYLTLLEASANITAPSGQTISPAAPGPQASVPSSQPSQAAQTSPQKAQIMWAGKGSPIEQGMTVGLKGPNGLPVPGEITQIDHSANGVKVRNPTTGQEEWHGNNDLQPFAAGNKPGQQSAPVVEESLKNSYSVDDRVNTPLGTGTIVMLDPNVNISGKVKIKLDSPENAGEDGKFKDEFVFTTDMLTHINDISEELSRLRQLAGISEDASGGASCAGAIASAPTAMGTTKRRQEVDEGPSLEHPEAGKKLVAGDQRTGQASGRLSANLAVRGKKTASRTNNGFKK